LTALRKGANLQWIVRATEVRLGVQESLQGDLRPTRVPFDLYLWCHPPEAENAEPKSPPPRSGRPAARADNITSTRNRGVRISGSTIPL